MSIDQAWLTLRLDGPLQSWGFDSQYNRRSTGLMPTKSAIAGMCCAAFGADRGSEKERQILLKFSTLRMTSISIPREIHDRKLAVHRLQDYHTIQNSRKADGKIKDCHITQRLYLTDAGFAVILFGSRMVCSELAEGLRNPKWGIWLGRKTCIPTAPVLVGVFDSQEEALKPILKGQPIEFFTRQEEVETFSDGLDSLQDQAVSFLSSNREFSPRRVRIIQGKA